MQAYTAKYEKRLDDKTKWEVRLEDMHISYMDVHGHMQIFNDKEERSNR